MPTKSLLIALALAACGDGDDRAEKAVERDTPPIPTPEVDRQLAPPPIDLEYERWRLAQEIDRREKQLDAKIDELERRGDEAARNAAAVLRAKRDQARAQLGEMKDTTRDNWATFEKHVTDAWDQLERDVTDATREPTS